MKLDYRVRYVENVGMTEQEDGPLRIAPGASICACDHRDLTPVH